MNQARGALEGGGAHAARPGDVICERLHKTILQEFYQVAFRTKIYTTIEELQQDLEVWLEHYNRVRPHQGKMCCGRTPYATMLAGNEIWNEKVATLN